MSSMYVLCSGCVVLTFWTTTTCVKEQKCIRLFTFKLKDERNTNDQCRLYVGRYQVGIQQ